MQQILKYQEIIDNRLRNYIFPDKPSNLYDPLRYFLKIGGKRTRPALTMLSCSLFGEPGIKALNAALAIEMFHNFTLIHDDIMDDAPLRRGQQTVHEKWNSDIAILSGDTLFTEAINVLAQNDAKDLPKLIAIYTKTSREVCEGQQMDMDYESSSTVTIPEYIEMIRLKTSVLLGAALEMGAIVAGVENKQDIQNIYDFGVNIGLAFQIQDDILDLYAESSKFGKQVGGDILANKKTFLLLKAFELADETIKKEMNILLDNASGDEKVIKMKQIFDQLKVREEAELLKTFYYKKALKNMEDISVSSESKHSLLELAESLMTREF